MNTDQKKISIYVIKTQHTVSEVVSSQPVTIVRTVQVIFNLTIPLLTQNLLRTLQLFSLKTSCNIDLLSFRHNFFLDCK